MGKSLCVAPLGMGWTACSPPLALGFISHEIFLDRDAPAEEGWRVWNDTTGRGTGGRHWGRVGGLSLNRLRRMERKGQSWGLLEPRRSHDDQEVSMLFHPPHR